MSTGVSVVDGADVRDVPPGSVAVAVAVLPTWAASTSDWVMT